ncbi:acetoin dehydrogenase complex dihydrolipoyl dehydrogenase [Bacillus subtilis]|uniref:acetoin dehydrogenase complex dihydrolipoyl dehydrogenase n=1 Tax=Bacillus subtilis TaxID=1423 RepID=UPI00119C7ED2|nr:acetoin dehydrogenase complex dihydrolipoyl dehydrogenase [Bacillus subtilis]MUG03197.1 dihydrolipoyl dehydrogenase [Bacillus tequilensis]TWG63240.1 dihydrolipoamide dehydrogenase [Bacillus subtilis J24]TWG71867.1 dihydrolipoamide dehydrogenase [Bacillus subtilis J26]
MTLAIIGGGPAGYAAAVSAAQQGRNVLLIDKGKLGGTCLNEGCIPTKSLLESANVLDKIKHADSFGIELPAGAISVDWSKMQSRKQQVVSQLVQGVQYLMKKNQIQVVKGTASFLSERKLLIEGENGKEIREADQVLIASGSEPIELPFAPFDGEWIIDSKDALSLSEIPSSLVIVGGGVIGCEYAGLFARLGSKVTIIETADQLIPAEDEDIARLFQEKLEEDGVEVHTSSRLERVDQTAKTAIWKSGQREFKTKADYVLVAIGRKPRLDELQLEQAGVDFSPKGIPVNGHMQTNVPHIYACGDAIGGIQLAHAAFHEGIIAASHASGRDVKINEKHVPRCIYTSPEIACIGMTERQARSIYGDVKIGEFSFSANGKALIKQQAEGKVKIMAEPEFGEIVGVSMIGPDVTELIGQAAAIMNGEMTADMAEHFIAAHPTLSETLHEALLSTIGLAVHA